MHGRRLTWLVGGIRLIAGICTARAGISPAPGNGVPVGVMRLPLFECDSGAGTEADQLTLARAKKNVNQSIRHSWGRSRRSRRRVRA